MQPRQDEIIEFYRQLALLVRAELPLPESLTGMARDCRDRNLRAAVEAMAGDIAKGTSLADALRKHGRVFPEFHVRLIHAGEQSGLLAEALFEVAQLARMSQGLTTKAKEVAAYPVLTLSVAAAVALLVGRYLFPELGLAVAGLYDANMPTASAALFALSRALVVAWVPVAGIYLIGVVFTLWLFSDRPRAKATLFRIIACLPGARGILYNHDLARVSGMLAVLVAHRAPLNSAITICAGTVTDPGLAAALNSLAARLAKGDRPADDDANCFQPAGALLSCLNRPHEQTLAEDLRQLRELYRERAEQATVRANTFWSLAACTLMAVIAGAVVVAMFTPLLQLYKCLNVTG